MAPQRLTGFLRTVAGIVTLPVVVASCAPTTAPAPRRPPLAKTECYDGAAGVEPAVYFNRKVVFGDPRAVVTIAAHEESHEAVMRLFPSCAAYRSWLAAGDHRMRDEALAFCAQATAAAAITGAPVSFELYGRWLAVGYPEYRLTPEAAAAEIERACREGVVIP